MIPGRVSGTTEMLDEHSGDPTLLIGQLRQLRDSTPYMSKEFWSWLLNPSFWLLKAILVIHS